jgi:RpiB/LacA/LacB family sugar-phosphate isomerase
MDLATGSDHAAYELKQIIANLLLELGHNYTDFGAFSADAPADNYHFIGAEVAHAVAEGAFDAGILMCGTGIGMCVAANKVSGASAALCNCLFTAEMSRRHNNANVLVIGARIVGAGLAKEIVRVWLATDYEHGRHVARNANLSAVERKYSCRE